MMIVGEAPGFHEDEIGKPFQGKSGKLLNECLSEVGLNRRDIYVTNIVKCRPPDNRPPEAKEIKACKSYLDEEIELVNPRLVMLLGRSAMKTIGKAKITEARGQVFRKDGVSYFPVFHPAYVLRDPGKMGVFLNDIRKFAALSRSESIIETEDVPWTIVTPDTFLQFIDEFQQADRFSFDLETTSLRWWHPEERINLLQIGLPTGAWVIPLDLGYWTDVGTPYRSAVADQHEWHRDLFQLLVAMSYHKVACAQNGKFDNLWILKRYGVRFYLNFDTQLASHLLDENSPNDLKTMVVTLLNGPGYDIPLKEKCGQVPSAWPKLMEYGAKDSVYTLQLMERFERELEVQPTLERIFRKMTMPAARLFERVELDGMYINLDAKKKLSKSLHERLDRLTEEMNEDAGRVINWNSPPQISKLFFEDLGMPVNHLTAKGKPSTSESAILDLKDQYPLAGKLATHREVDKMLSTYVDGWDQLRYGDRVYFSTKLHGTVTGRFAGRLHQTPRDEDIRSLIDAPDGWTFAAPDYSQIELRIVAEISQDSEMLRIFQSGGDIHTRTASALLAKEDLTKEERKMAKAVNFGFIYGMGWKKFIIYAWEKYGVRLTERQSKQFRNRFFEMYAGLPRWHSRQRRIVRAAGSVRTLTGRLRRLPQIHSPDEAVAAEAERLAINSPVQGFAAELKAMAMIELGEEFPEHTMRLKGEVHDSILMWIKTDQLKRVIPRVKAIMEAPRLLSEFDIQLSVPIVADIEIGPWGKGVKP